MTKNQQQIMNAIKNSDDWITIAEIAKITNIFENNVYKVLRTTPFLRVDQAQIMLKNGRTAAVYRMPVKITGTDMALNLAKQHPGLWGQLHWVKHETILHGMPTRKAGSRWPVA